MSAPIASTEDSIAVLRDRHDAFLAEAQRTARVVAPERLAGRNPVQLSASDIVSHETIPGGWSWSGVVARGRTLRIANTSGTAGVSALFWNADETSERYNAADTMKVQWVSRLGKARVILSDMGRAMLSITDDTCGRHDLLAGGSSPRTGGGMPVTRNSRENFLLMAAKHGLDRRDVQTCITFFAQTKPDAAGKLAWVEGASTPGDYVDLRAEMNVLAMVSNCPHPFAPSAQSHPGAIDLTLWRSAAPVADDIARTWSPETERVFAANDLLFAEWT